MLGFFRNTESPSYRLDRARLITFYNLEIGELIASGVLGFLFPLLIIGNGLPFIAKVAAIGSLWIATFLLFFIRRDERNIATWIALMVPFWMRQRRFRSARPSGRVTSRTERLDDLTAFGGNALSFAYVQGPDGEDELHVYEHPLRPYRAFVMGPADTRFVDPSPAGAVTRWG